MQDQMKEIEAFITTFRHLVNNYQNMDYKEQLQKRL